MIKVGTHYSCRTWCTKDIAIEPSPTADATRLTFPPRTSPTAKMPGTLVSSRCGAMGSGQIVARKIGPGLDKSSSIERKAAGNPPRIWNRSHHDKHMLDVVSFDQSRLRVPPAHTLEMRIALESLDYRMRVDNNRLALRSAESNSATCSPLFLRIGRACERVGLWTRDRRQPVQPSCRRRPQLGLP